MILNLRLDLASDARSIGPLPSYYIDTIIRVFVTDPADNPVDFKINSYCLKTDPSLYIGIIVKGFCIQILRFEWFQIESRFQLVE